jgi:hypothetical protein
MRDDMTLTRPDSSFSKLIHACHSARYRPTFARVPEHLHEFLRVVTGVPKHKKLVPASYLGAIFIQSRVRSDTEAQ